MEIVVRVNGKEQWLIAMEGEGGGSTFSPVQFVQLFHLGGCLLIDSKNVNGRVGLHYPREVQDVSPYAVRVLERLQS
jgi:hypothetical protein